MTLSQQLQELSDRVMANIPHNIDLEEVAYAIATLAKELEGRIVMGVAYTNHDEWVDDESDDNCEVLKTCICAHPDTYTRDSYNGVCGFGDTEEQALANLQTKIDERVK